MSSLKTLNIAIEQFRKIQNYAIGGKSWRHFRVAHVFPRLRLLHAFSSSFDWFTGLSVSSVIGQSDYVGFPLHHPHNKQVLQLFKIEHHLSAQLPDCPCLGIKSLSLSGFMMTV